MNKCTDCLLDLTDACPRGAGRATDDEICDSFFAKEVYEVNKNDSWQLGYQMGRKDAIAEIEKAMHEAYKGTSHEWECMIFDLKMRELKEQKNE